MKGKGSSSLRDLPEHLRSKRMDDRVPINLIFWPGPDKGGYGRKINVNYVKELASRFDPDLVRITVSMREDGSFACIDGNHTVEAARLCGYDELPCTVFLDVTVEEEAWMFAELNNVKRLNAAQKFHGRVIARDPVALEIVRKLQLYGLELSHSGGGGHGKVTAVASLLYVHSTYGLTRLADTISTLKEAFDTDRHGFKSEAIEGMAMFLVRYAADLDRRRLIDLLKTTGASKMLQNVLNHRALSPKDSPAVAWGKQARDLYNRGLRRDSVKLLPEWKSRMYSEQTIAGMPARGKKGFEARLAKGEDISATVKRGLANRRK